MVILYSGGIDSFLMYHYALSKGYKPEDIKCIYVDFEHKYSEREKQVIKKSKINITTIQIKGLLSLISSRLSNQIIPSRNLLLATIGAMISNEVWLGALDGEQNGKERDKSDKFFQDTSDLLTYTNSFFTDKTKVIAPFRFMSKAEVIRWGIDNGVCKQKMFEAVSCYSGTYHKCGQCLTCYKRYTAFLLNGITEPNYKNNPLHSKYAQQMRQEIPKADSNKDYSRFSKKRIKEHYQLEQIIGEKPNEYSK